MKRGNFLLQIKFYLKNFFHKNPFQWNLRPNGLMSWKSEYVFSSMAVAFEILHLMTAQWPDLNLGHENGISLEGPA